jgi:hypothetical protein
MSLSPTMRISVLPPFPFPQASVSQMEWRTSSARRKVSSKCLVRPLLNAFLFEQAGQVRSLEAQEFGGFDLPPIAPAHSCFENACTVLFEEIFSQGNEILGTISQGGQSSNHHVKSEIQIFTEGDSFDPLLQIPPRFRIPWKAGLGKGQG